jgi:hypothetical protein
MKRRKQLTPIEAARRLGVWVGYIYGLIWSGKLLSKS